MKGKEEEREGGIGDVHAVGGTQRRGIKGCTKTKRWMCEEGQAEDEIEEKDEVKELYSARQEKREW